MMLPLMFRQMPTLVVRGTPAQLGSQPSLFHEGEECEIAGTMPS